MTSMPLIIRLQDCHDTELVGGKAANLGRLIRAGFPVPPGFVLTKRAFHLTFASGGASHELPLEVRESLRESYRELGEGRVAVRSSATAEDSAGASMAGQFESILDIEGHEALFAAVQKCWASIDVPRIQAYRRKQNIDRDGLDMAVVVQRLIRAERAGVLFTTNPHRGHFGEMLIEASWGLGESLVSGTVQPDSLRLDQKNGRVLEARRGDKSHASANGASRNGSRVSTSDGKTCLRNSDVYHLWEAGRKIAAAFGCPQDIEWAIADDKLYILQSRPVTTLGNSEALEAAVADTRRQLADQATAGRGPWILHNLAETLPHPTPLTWSVMQRFMSGNGGWGNLYRTAGFSPSALVFREGFLELIGGRIYMDAARAPELLSSDYPYGYDLAELRSTPDVSQTSPTAPRGSWVRRWQAGRQLAGARKKLLRLSVHYDKQLREVIFPQFVDWVAAARREGYRSVSNEELIKIWNRCEQAVLDEFAPQALLPTLICQQALQELEQFLVEHLWNEDVHALSLELASGAPANSTVVSDQELFEVGIGRRTQEDWVANHGHRANQEFELSAPRWRSHPDDVSALAARLASGTSPLERHRRHVQKIQSRMDAVRGQLFPGAARELNRRVMLVHRFEPFREDSKHYLMLGYDLIRDLALEAGRRLELDNDVFYLTQHELFESLRSGYAPLHEIEQRKAAFRVETELELPAIIDHAALAGIGLPASTQETGEGPSALALSAGKASGPARVLLSPTQQINAEEGYILVCPTTDPSWTPLFINAAGLVVERGGSLSHGAVVARELGLPAVVLPGATQRFHDGEMLCVDGTVGHVGPVSDSLPRSPYEAAPAPDSLHVAPVQVPPAPGRKDRLAGRIRNICALAWVIWLLAFFWLPGAGIRSTTMAAFDFVLWPLVRALGKPACVALAAASMALLVLLLQRFATDNRRLREAKRRARDLTREARSLPESSARRKRLLALAAPVTSWTLQAAIVPVGILLGLLLVPFVWFQERVDPAVTSPPPGSAVQIVALVHADCQEPVQVEMPPDFALDSSTPATRMLGPLRPTLERLLTLLRQPREDSSQPWELSLLPDPGREQMANDLQAYLDAGLPPQGVTWLVHTPASAIGAFPISVRAGSQPATTLGLVLGDSKPPVPMLVSGEKGTAIAEVRMVIPRPKEEAVFWRPFARFAGEIQLPVWLGTWNVSWLWLYILSYVMSLLVCKRLLRVA